MSKSSSEVSWKMFVYVGLEDVVECGNVEVVELSNFSFVRVLTDVHDFTVVRTSSDVRAFPVVRSLGKNRAREDEL